MKQAKQFYRAIGHSRWAEGETPTCTHCDQPAAWMTPIDHVLLCNSSDCHTQYIYTECIEVVLIAESNDDDGKQEEPARPNRTSEPWIADWIPPTVEPIGS